MCIGSVWAWDWFRYCFRDKIDTWNWLFWHRLPMFLLCWACRLSAIIIRRWLNIGMTLGYCNDKSVWDSIANTFARFHFNRRCHVFFFRRFLRGDWPKFVKLLTLIPCTIIRWKRTVDNKEKCYFHFYGNITHVSCKYDCLKPRW